MACLIRSAIRTDYARQMHGLAQQYAQHDIGASIFLVGSVDRANWLPMWRDFADQTQGVMVEVKSADEITRAIEALPIVAPAITPTLTPTQPPASPTPRPTLTPHVNTAAIASWPCLHCRLRPPPNRRFPGY